MSRPTYKVIALSDRHSLIKISATVAIITTALKRPGKGGRRARLVSAYAGFDTQSAAIAFVNGIKGYLSKCYCQVRRSQRLATEWEVKCRYFNESALEVLMWSYAADPAIVASADMTPQQAKACIMPIEPVQPMTISPIRPIALADAPTLYRSSRPLKVAGGLSIE